MFASLSQENTILEVLREQEIAIRFFARLQDKISPSKILQALNGESRLSTEQLTPLVELARELRELAQEHLPVRIAWKNPELYAAILAERRERREQRDCATV